MNNHPTWPIFFRGVGIPPTSDEVLPGHIWRDLQASAWRRNSGRGVVSPSVAGPAVRWVCDACRGGTPGRRWRRGRGSRRCEAPIGRHRGRSWGTLSLWLVGNSGFYSFLIETLDRYENYPDFTLKQVPTCTYMFIYSYVYTYVYIINDILWYTHQILYI